jgi:pimeloyl-ACP methyl ester carboxylesterase
MMKKLALLFLFTIQCCINANAQPVRENRATENVEVQLQSLGYQVNESRFGRFTQHTFQMKDGIQCIVVSPEKPAVGNPWVWRARFWGHQPQFDQAMLDRGWHVGYCDVGSLFGADPALQRWDRFYALAQALGLSSKPLLEGMSRGGLIIMRWATAHPDQVCGIYADNAVMDIRSWPGGKGVGTGHAGTWQNCLKAYGMTEAESVTFHDGPLDRLTPLANARVPIFALINEADDVVPPEENGDLLIEKYKSLGGSIQEMRRPGLGHHPHSLQDPEPLVQFALKCVE